MKERNYALLGVAAPLVAFIFIAVSIALSPWFSWGSSALSDLGHSVSSSVAPLFNFGLLLCGFLMIVYSFTCFRKYAKYSSYTLVLAGLSLQLIATFDEVYRPLHFIFSVLFFASIGLASLTYFIEKKSKLALVALIVGALSWILYGLDFYSAGIAVPETISAVAVVSWVMLYAFRIYSQKTD